MFYKNTASKFYVYAYTPADGLPKTGDAANITAYVAKDFGAATVLADTTASEVDATNAPGLYVFDAAQGETNADVLMVSGKSSTSGVKVLGAPAVIYTMPTTGVLSPATLGRTAVVDANGLIDANTVKIGPTGSGTPQTARDVGASVLVGDKTGFSLSAAGVQAIWDALTSALTTVGSIGKKLADWVVGTIDTYTGNTKQTGDAFARLGAPAGASVSADLVSIKTDTGTTIPGRLPAALGANGNMKADVRDVNGVAQTATLDTIKAQTATIATDTGTTIPAAIAAVQADLPQRITKNVALAGFPFLMVDSADHITPKTGLTVTATRSLDGAAFASCANAVSELSNGWYVISLAAGDLNGNTVALKFAATGADTRNIMLVTQPT